MPTASGKPLGERLARLANRQHAERVWEKDPRSSNPTLLSAGIKTKENYNKFIQTPQGQKYLDPKPFMEDVYHPMPRATTPPKMQEKKDCGPKPMAWIGTQKNPAYTKWVECSAGSAGGRRRTRKRKTTRRLTRRRR